MSLSISLLFVITQSILYLIILTLDTLYDLIETHIVLTYWTSCLLNYYIPLLCRISMVSIIYWYLYPVITTTNINTYSWNCSYTWYPYHIVTLYLSILVYDLFYGYRYLDDVILLSICGCYYMSCCSISSCIVLTSWIPVIYVLCCLLSDIINHVYYWIVLSPLVLSLFILHISLP